MRSNKFGAIKRIRVKAKEMDMKDFDIFDHMDGIPDKESEKVRAQEVYKKVRNEFKKISKEDALGYSLQAVYIAHIIIDNECDCNEKVPPSYRLYANGTNDKDLQVILDKAIQKFIKEGNYFFHYYCHQLEREFPRIIDEYLNYNNIKDEYWCKLLSDNDTTLSGKKSYNFIILHFDKVVLETNITYKGKRHPFLDALKHEWSFGKVNDIDNRKINYNELFCRAAHKENSFVYLYEDIFNALHFTPLHEVKVLILGQDPYHNEHQAHGLSFSVLPDQKDIPPSLQNIYKELHDDLGCRIPNNGYLKKWADQGVLLLNTVLTVRAHQANSHQGHGWEQFTDAIIQAVNAQDRPIVYMLWGRPAQSKIPMLTNPKHLILKAPHPSPLSAYRGFFGCRHFSQANAFLEKNGIEPIDWQIEDV